MIRFWDYAVTPYDQTMAEYIKTAAALCMQKASPGQPDGKSANYRQMILLVGHSALWLRLINDRSEPIVAEAEETARKTLIRLLRA